MPETDNPATETDLEQYDGPTAIYARVSTNDQDLDQQVETCWRYATERLAIDADEIDVYRDKSTGTDANRDGFQSLMRKIEADEYDRLIIRRVSRMFRSMGDLVTTVDSLVDDHETGVHFVKSGLSLEPNSDDHYTRAMIQMNGVYADLNARIIQENTKDAVNAAQSAGKWVGRPPFGFETDGDGYLVPDPDEYQLAREAIDRVDRGESKRSTASAIGVGRKTLDRILERRDMYESDE